MLSIKEIKTKYEHKDVNGNVADTFIKIPRYFEDIEFIYSDSLEKGKVKFSTTMQKLYCYLLGWQESGLTCYEAHEELSNVCRLSRSKTTELILLMERVGLIKVVKIEGRRNKELIALPITDSHLNPPESIHASPVEDVKPISNAIPQVVIEEPAQCDTEALSDNVKECPFFTSSEEAYQDELEFDSLPIATTHTKRVNSDMEPLSNIFINYLSEGGRLTNESFAEFARRVFEDTDNKYPAGFEIYFSKAYPKIYEEFELPF